jgi:hypothetical protein
MSLRAGYIVTSPNRLGKYSPLLCDNIDPITHDFKSLFISLDPIDAQVLIALKIDRASGACVTEDGNKLRSVKKMSDSAQSEIRSIVLDALSRLIARRDIQYKGVTFDAWNTASQTGTAVVKWVNLRALDNVIRSQEIRIGE